MERPTAAGDYWNTYIFSLGFSCAAAEFAHNADVQIGANTSDFAAAAKLQVVAIIIYLLLTYVLILFVYKRIQYYLKAERANNS